MQTVRAPLSAADLRFALVASRFNELITERLIRGAVDTIVRHGGREDLVTHYSAPGAWEIPIIAQHVARRGGVSAILCLGCVIRGETPHFDYVAGAAANGALRISLDSGIPVTFGVITADNLEQALERAGGKAGNKGAEAALAAIEVASLLRTMG